MLKIRSEHMSALAVQQSVGFAGRMMLHLREVFPAEVATLNDPKLRAFVERVCAIGAEWGITDEPHAERLIELFASFDELRRKPLLSPLAEIVEFPDRTGEQILCMLEERLLFGESA